MSKSFRLTVAATLFALACSATIPASPVPQETGGENEESILQAYTKSNLTYSTIDEILQEIAANKRQQEDHTEEHTEEHTINKRALGCESTSVAYGSTYGTAFADFAGTHPWPCGVDITEITIWHNWAVDAIQVNYKTVDQRRILKPKRGGGGGAGGTGGIRYTTVIFVRTGERLTGVTGMVCSYPNRRYTGVYVRQLVFLLEKQDGQKVAYGPYGAQSATHTHCRVFAVNGKISSIFGRVTDINLYPNPTVTVLGAIGFYYEDESRHTQHAF